MNSRDPTATIQKGDRALNDKNDHAFALEFRLRKLDPALHRRFLDAKWGLQNILSDYTRIFPEYTDHSELHIMTVVDLCNRLIGPRITELNADEIYCLLTGCYFHDIGMGISRKDQEEFSRSIDLQSYAARHPEADLSDQVRFYHHEYSGMFVRKYAPFFEFPTDAHLEAIVQIARGHRKTDLLNENEYPLSLAVPGGSVICLPYLAALLRLADEADVTAARNPLLLYDFDEATTDAQRMINLRHMAVRRLDVSEDALTLFVDDSDPAVTEEVIQTAQKLKTTLDHCRAAVNGRTPHTIPQREVQIRTEDRFFAVSGG